MPFVEYHQRLYALREGENRVGGDARCDVRLPNLPPGEELRIVVRGDEAFIQGAGRPARVNGRPVNSEAAPLQDQDRVEVGDTAILYVDERARGGRGPTGPERPERPSGASDAAAAPEARRAGTVPVLTRLDDGEVYVLDRTGLKIGREKNCDIVIPDRSVSRLHAEITLEGNRYTLRDLSRNGTLVNGEKARANQPLRVGDVVGIGNYELRLSKRPASAMEAVHDVTPVRAAVPDAPTVQVKRGEEGGGWGPVVLRWSLILALAGMAAFVLLTR